MVKKESRITSQICKRLGSIERSRASSSVLADVQEIRDLVDKLELELRKKAVTTRSIDNETPGTPLVVSSSVNTECDSDEEWAVLEASVYAMTGTHCGSLDAWTLQWKDSIEVVEEESTFAPSRIARSSAIRCSFDSNSIATVSSWDSGSSYASLPSNQACRYYLDWSWPYPVSSKGGRNEASRTSGGNEDGRAPDRRASNSSDSERSRGRSLI
jgi:hypothetical protein